MDTLCKYPSRNCQNPRSLKIGGELHRFCIAHRCKANAAQRRWSTKRQASEGTSQGTSSRKRDRDRDDNADTSSSDEGSSAPCLPHKIPRVDLQPMVCSPEHQNANSTDEEGWRMPVLSDQDVIELCALVLDADDGHKSHDVAPVMIQTTPQTSVDCWWDPTHRHFAALLSQEWQL